VVERWRGAMMSQKAGSLEFDSGPMERIPVQPVSAAHAESDRLRLLKRPVAGSAADAFTAPERAVAANPVRWPQQR
jgi:hypothetical protein